MSAAILTHLDPVLTDIKPDWVLVQGDTTTVAITALLAYYQRIKVGHVEAGLRTHDKWQPFPEEINRRVAGVAADLHFAPTEWARQNLLREGVSEKTNCGSLAIRSSTLDRWLLRSPCLNRLSSLLHSLNIGTGGRRLILVTAHRRENFGEPLESICEALKRLASRGDVEIVYPVHLNPNVKEPVHRLLGNLPHVTLLPPLDYLPLVHLMKRASLVLTDSGGIQEEAPAFGIPVLVLREVTERPEGVEAGTLKLVGTDTERIFSQAAQLLDDPAEYAKMAKAANPFGDGHAAERIVQALVDYQG